MYCYYEHRLQQIREELSLYRTKPDECKDQIRELEHERQTILNELKYNE